MVKRIIVGAVVVGVVAGVVAYFKVDMIDGKRVNDVAFEVVEEENVPGEIRDEIKRFGKEVRRSSYICSDELYIVVYYGEQSTDGYSIEVNKLYESENAIFVETVLMGPKSYKEIKDVESYPYIVLKIPVSHKKVVFI